MVDYRRQSREHTPITIDKTPVERVSSFKFLGVHITEDLTWSAHTDAVLKKAHQRLFFLRRLRKFGTSPRISGPSTPALWRASWPAVSPPGMETAPLATAGSAKGRANWPATLLEVSFPPSRISTPGGCTRKARGRIIKDSSHPSHRLLSLLPSGRRFRSIRSRTSRTEGQLFPSGYQANEQSQITHLHHTPTHTTCHALPL